jgi:hypothetical protein
MRCHLEEEKSHDVLERGEKAVLEYLRGAGWTELEIYRNAILSIEGEEGLEAETVKRKGIHFGLSCVMGSTPIVRCMGNSS